MTAGGRLKHKTMSLVAADEIRERILGGALAPGTQLRQDALANEFGMSRIPVREALLLLEAEGMVKILPHRGAVVVKLSAEEIDELFNMRILLEPFLYERSAPRLDSGDFRELQENVDRYERSLSAKDISNWNEINTDFHMTLYKHAGSPRVMATVQNLLAECDLHTRIQLSHAAGDRERAVREHAELLDLTRKGRFEEGGLLLRQHIEHIRGTLVRLLTGPDASDAVGQSPSAPKQGVPPATQSTKG